MKELIETFIREVIAWIVFFGDMRRLVEDSLDELEARVVDVGAEIYFRGHPHAVVN